MSEDKARRYDNLLARVPASDRDFLRSMGTRCTLFCRTSRQCAKCGKLLGKGVLTCHSGKKRTQVFYCWDCFKNLWIDLD